MHPALADNETHAAVCHELTCEPFHARRGRRADTDRLIACREGIRNLDFTHIGRGMDDCVAVEVEARLAATVEQGDIAGVANAEQGLLQGDRIAYAQLPHL